MDHDGESLNEIVLPLLNVNRKMRNGMENSNEAHQQQLFMTSASSRGCYAYDKLIELFINSVVTPEESFVFGCDYRVPMRHGLLDKRYLKEIKMSSTYSDDTFAREYIGTWGNGSKGAWFEYEKMIKYRRLQNPEWKANQNSIQNKELFYLISTDVGRLNCQTVVTVYKVWPLDNHYQMNIVNIFILGKTPETKHFSIQARDLKRIWHDFNAKEILIDGAGMGVGLLDWMTKETVDESNGMTYPPMCAFNNDDYSKKLYKDALDCIYVMKSNSTLQKKIDSNCYAMVFSGRVTFLAREQETKNKLLGTKIGQKLPIEKRIARLLPHELTTKLMNQTANFKLKIGSSTNASDIVLEKINSSMLSDMYSSFEYGLWRIHELEEERFRKNQKKTKGRKLVFYN